MSASTLQRVPLLRDVELGIMQIKYKGNGRLRNRVKRGKVREIFDMTTATSAVTLSLSMCTRKDNCGSIHTVSDFRRSDSREKNNPCYWVICHGFFASWFNHIPSPSFQPHSWFYIINCSTWLSCFSSRTLYVLVLSSLFASCLFPSLSRLQQGD